MGWQVRWTMGVWMVAGMAACSTADPSEDGGGSTSAAGGDGVETGTTASLPQDDDDDDDDDADDDDASSTGEPGSESDGDGTATGGTPESLLDCDALCDPYEACDESAFLTCLSNCEDIVPPLAAFDEGCGAASAAYFECRFTQSCEDVTAWLDDVLEPDPCADALDDYLAACVAVVPEHCDAYCDAQVACWEPDPDNLAGCQFECLLYEGWAVIIDDGMCDAATSDVLGCLAEGRCVDSQLVGCEAEIESHAEACCPGLPGCDADDSA